MGYSTYSMDHSSKKSSFVTERHAEPDASERRRVARIVHDDRGNASVKWHDAPANYRRQVLEIESEDHGLQIETKPRSFDPYASAQRPEPPPKKAAAGAKTDLRKLGEWIKMMRDLEERKRKGEID